jgi:hypothetical protein
MNKLSKLKIFYWKIRIILLALRWIPQINIGDDVLYNGKKYTVVNGVRYNMWRLSPLSNGDNGWVYRKSCKKVFSFKNFKHSFLSGYFFYKTSWLDIWVNKGIQDWMKSCNIWPWPFRKF